MGNSQVTHFIQNDFTRIQYSNKLLLLIHVNFFKLAICIILNLYDSPSYSNSNISFVDSAIAFVNYCTTKDRAACPLP